MDTETAMIAKALISAFVMTIVIIVCVELKAVLGKLNYLEGMIRLLSYHQQDALKEIKEEMMVLEIWVGEALNKSDPMGEREELIANERATSKVKR